MKARLAVVAATALALCAPSAAQAGTSGSLSLTLTTKTQKAFKARGITVRAAGKAVRSGRKVTLPLAGTSKALTTSGTLQLRAAKRSITLGSPRFELGSNARVTAVIGGKRTTLLKLAAAPDVTAAGVQLPRTEVTLAAAPARTIARKLRVSKLPSGAFGQLAATATFTTTAPTPGTTTPVASTPSGPCRTTTAGGPALSPGSGVPPVKARPAGARTVTSASVTWHPRESFVRYVNSGDGTSTAAGATSDAPEVLPGTDAALTYSFHFPFAGGWCDPATGAARITFTGTVAFKYADHAIDLRVNDPEVELDGAASRVIFRMTGSGDTDGGNQRAVVETLDVSKAVAVNTGSDARSFAYERIPGAVPPGAASSVFAGYYLPGDPFGWVSISYTTD